MTRYELREAEGLCHDNWTEIQRLRRYIPALQKLLRENGIEYPPEEEFCE
ncbi:mobility-associated LCxxNW protein [Blautia producta]